MAAETENQPIRFKWDDEEIELVDVNDLDMDEWEILYDYSGLVLSDFAPVMDENKHVVEEADRERQRRLEQPKFWRAMFHISYRRAHPDADEDALREFARSVKLTSALASMGGNDEQQEEEPAAPLGLTRPLSESSKSNSAASNERESTASRVSSDEPDGEPLPTGTAA